MTIIDNFIYAPLTHTFIHSLTQTHKYAREGKKQSLEITLSDGP